MIRIVMIIVFLVFLYLLILAVYNFIKKEKGETTDIFDRPKHKEDINIHRVYSSAINFDDVSIKDRNYLNTFIDEINPNLPKMQRLKKSTVDITSYLFNKKSDKVEQ